ncbi:MAG: SDR family NAD(P)-dependent oxidoreductase, partial [Actinobacteria bacterium]|nr:SDR family NAD(P)-dependent oxidoreductase [Actinomycetota bacterium]
MDSTNTFRIDGKVAIVTGASSGLGTRFARVLAGAGAHVIITARRSERLNALAEQLSSEDVEVTPIALDLSDPEAPSELVALASERFGRLDI